MANMNGFLQTRKRWLQERRPTEEELHAAEVAAFRAVYSGPRVLVSVPKIPDDMIATSSASQSSKSIEESESNCQKTGLSETTDEDFLYGIRVNGRECMTTAYELRHPIQVSPVSGALSTSLPEDVFHLVDTHLNLLVDFITAKDTAEGHDASNVILEAVTTIVDSLSYHHMRYRYSFLQDLESSIASGNDLMRMVDKIESMKAQLKNSFPFLDWDEDMKNDNETVMPSSRMAQRGLSELVLLYSNDSVNACYRAVNFVMQKVQSSHQMTCGLFSKEWEDVMTHNELAQAIVKTTSEYVSEMETFIDHPFLYYKVIASLVRGTVCFYIRNLVEKAKSLRRAMKKDFGNKRAVHQVVFMSGKRAATRISYDVQVFRNYFQYLARDNETLFRIVMDELSVLVILLECIWLAIEGTKSLDEFIIVVHKNITGGDVAVTQSLLSDIWLLWGEKDKQHAVEEAVEFMRQDLQLISSRVDETTPRGQEAVGNFGAALKLDQVLKTLYEDRIAEAAMSLCGSFVKRVDFGGKVRKK